jgi:hypothetical protein
MKKREPVITPWSFAQALEAAGIIHDRDRISEIVIRCKPEGPVMIEVAYFADERIYTLSTPPGGRED